MRNCLHQEKQSYYKKITNTFYSGLWLDDWIIWWSAKPKCGKSWKNSSVFLLANPSQSSFARPNGNDQFSLSSARLRNKNISAHHLQCWWERSLSSFRGAASQLFNPKRENVVFEFMTRKSIMASHNLLEFNFGYFWKRSKHLKWKIKIQSNVPDILHWCPPVAAFSGGRNKVHLSFAARQSCLLWIGCLLNRFLKHILSKGWTVKRNEIAQWSHQFLSSRLSLHFCEQKNNLHFSISCIHFIPLFFQFFYSTFHRFYMHFSYAGALCLSYSVISDDLNVKLLSTEFQNTRFLLRQNYRL